MTGPESEEKPSRAQVYICAELHKLLTAKATAEGRVIKRLVEDKLWELFPEHAPAHRTVMGVLL